MNLVIEWRSHIQRIEGTGFVVTGDRSDLVGVPEIRARLSRPCWGPHPFGVPCVRNAVHRSPQSLLQATAWTSCMSSCI